MKPLLLHGSAKTASRKKLIELKTKFNPNNVIVFEEGFDVQAIMGSLFTSSLFPEERLFILENPPDDISNYQLQITNYQLILWFDHEINAKKWSDFEVLFFPEGKEVSVFPFLDCLASQDKKAFLEMEKLKSAGFDIYYFSTMVFYLLRSLAATPQNATQFVKDKLQRQRKNFSLDRVAKLYKDILEIDFRIKSGFLEKEQAEFLLVNNFLES